MKQFINQLSGEKIEREGRKSLQLDEIMNIKSELNTLYVCVKVYK